MNNAFGLDADYFQRLCKREFNDDVIRSQTPSDLARAFARASRTADASVMNEPEFTRELSADNQRLREDRDSHQRACMAQIEKAARLLEALEFACKSLAQVTSSDGSGHADIALSCLRMAGVDADERERMVGGWTAKCQWRIHAALAGSKESN